jgi:hypothetical protein
MLLTKPLCYWTRAQRAETASLFLADLMQGARSSMTGEALLTKPLCYWTRAQRAETASLFLADLMQGARSSMTGEALHRRVAVGNNVWGSRSKMWTVVQQLRHQLHSAAAVEVCVCVCGV